MKLTKLFLIQVIMLSLSTTVSFGQFQSKLHLNTYLGAYKLNYNEGVYPFESFGNSLSINPQIGIDYYTDNNFFTGLGAEYQYLSAESNRVMIADSFYSETQTKLTNTAIVPFVSVGARIPLGQKLFFTNRVRFSYAFAKNKGEYAYSGFYFEPVSGSYSIANIGRTPVNYKDELENSFQYFKIGYSPELSWYINEKTALQLQAGRAEYAKEENADKGEWAFSFNPRFWLFGVSFIF
jgi:hypothetical protein